MTGIAPIRFLGQFSSGNPDIFYILKWGGVLAGAFVILFFVQHMIRRSIVRRGSHIASEEERLRDLSALKKRGLLSDEEMKRVRTVMARKFIDQQKAEAEVPKGGKGFSALEQLALEAERLESQLPVKEKAGTELAAAPPPEIPEAESLPAPVPLPSRLHNLLLSPETEWEDMRNAGFLTGEDVELLRAAREERDRK